MTNDEQMRSYVKQLAAEVWDETEVAFHVLGIPVPDAIIIAETSQGSHQVACQFVTVGQFAETLVRDRDHNASRFEREVVQGLAGGDRTVKLIDLRDPPEAGRLHLKIPRNRRSV